MTSKVGFQMSSKGFFRVWTFAIIGLWTGISAMASPSPVKIVVGIPPYGTLLKSIGGDWVQVTTLLERGGDPHHFHLDSRKRKSLNEMDLYFVSSLPFERQILEKLNEQNVARFQFLDDDLEAHSDPHTWLSPLHMRKHVEIMTLALETEIPAHAKEIRARGETVKSEIEQCYATLAEALKPQEGQTLITYHPAWSHFLHPFGITQRRVEGNHHQISSSQLRSLRDIPSHQRLPILLARSQDPIGRVKTTALQLGLEVEVVDPLTSDYFALLDTLQQALSSDPGDL